MPDFQKQIRAYWDGAGAAKDFSAPFDLAAFSLFVPLTAAVLDVGCGYGRTLAELQMAGYGRLLGLDPSPGLLARGRAEHPQLALARFDGRTLPCADETLTAVLLVGVLTALPLDRDQDLLLAEIHRVLAPKGVFVLGDFALNTDARNLARYAQGLARYGLAGVFDLPQGGLARHHGPERVREITAPYIPLHFRLGRYQTMNGNLSAGFFFLGRKPG